MGDIVEVRVKVKVRGKVRGNVRVRGRAGEGKREKGAGSDFM
jgi:hypothetical protein